LGEICEAVAFRISHGAGEGLPGTEGRLATPPSVERNRTVAIAESTPSVARERTPLFSSVAGLASLGVLLQGLWAGLFFGDPGSHDLWVRVHSIGGMVTGALALAAAVVALAQLRHRRDVVVGAIVFFVLVVAEIGLGEAVGDQRGLVAVHIPLAMALMGLAVWLPLRATRRG
jgi:hypothetical protein